MNAYADHPELPLPEPPAATHDPCCSAHGVPLDCKTYRATHFVDVRPCCAADMLVLDAMDRDERERAQRATTGPDPMADLTEARRLRDEGMALAQAADDDRGSWDTQVIDTAIEYLCRQGRVWSANDMRTLLPEVRQPLIGVRMRAAARSGRIVKVGHVESNLPSTHGHEIKTWRGSEFSLEEATA